MLETIVNFSIKFNELAEPIFISNERGEFIYCNTAFSKLFNMPCEKIIGMTIFELVPKISADKFNKINVEILKHGGSNITDLKINGGSNQINLLYRIPLHENNGEITGICGFILKKTNFQQKDVAVGQEKKHLTARESEILNLVAIGHSSKIIAYQLKISHHTVVHHMKNIYLKLNVKSRTNAIIKAHHQSILNI